jgi:hypothetical protein
MTSIELGVEVNDAVASAEELRNEVLGALPAGFPVEVT